MTTGLNFVVEARAKDHHEWKPVQMPSGLQVFTQRVALQLRARLEREKMQARIVRYHATNGGHEVVVVDEPCAP